MSPFVNVKNRCHNLFRCKRSEIRNIFYSNSTTLFISKTLSALTFRFFSSSFFRNTGFGFIIIMVYRTKPVCAVE